MDDSWNLKCKRNKEWSVLCLQMWTKLVRLLKKKKNATNYHLFFGLHFFPTIILQADSCYLQFQMEWNRKKPIRTSM